MAPRSRLRMLAISIPLAFLLCFALWVRFSVEEETALAAPSQNVTVVEAAHPQVTVQDPFTEFTAWMSRYLASGENREALVDAGIPIVQARAARMKELMQSDPESALAESVSISERKAMPEEIRAYLEEPFSVRGSLDVFPLCNDLESHGLNPEPSSEGHRRQGGRIELSDSRGNQLDGYVFGTREGPLSRDAISVQGIRLEGIAALREEMFTPVPSRDLADARLRYTLGETGIQRDFLTGQAIGTEPVVALSGGQLFAFANVANLRKVNAAAARLERKIGMENGSQLIFASRLTLGHEPLDLDAVEEEGDVMEAIASDTTRSAIVILVDFSDKVGTPINATTLQTRFDGEVHDQVASMSFHQTGIAATVDPRVFRMPQPTTYYNGTDGGSKKNGDLFNHAIAAANAAGLVTSGYNHRCVIFKGIGMGYCGLATVGGNKIWLPCYGSKVIVHELGHNFGLLHASFWSSSSQDPVDPSGSSTEYGDNTSIMGGGGVTSGHFHVQGKRKLGWLNSGSQYTINDSDSSQVVRIFRFDHEDTAAANAKRAIRVQKGIDEFYWLGYRQRFTGSSFQNYQKGIQIHWEQTGKSKAWLVDTIPGGSKNDSGVALGKTYSDFVADVHITPLKRGGSSPDQWIEVEVNVGEFPGNQPPEGTLNLPERYAVNEAVPIGSSMSDPDEDTLAYYFGSGTTVMGNDANLEGRNYTWSSTGSKSLVLIASDRKGGGVTKNGSILIQTAMAAPANLSASDGAFSDRIDLSWSAVTGATHYAVYRSETASAFGATLVTSVDSANTSWSDVNAVPGTDYTYFLQALGSNTASAFTPGENGMRAEGPPDVPAGVSASQNLFTDRVRIEWSGSETASSFEILRGESDAIGSAIVLGETPARSFDDTGAIPGVEYFYWVRAKNTLGNSESASAAGSRKLDSPLSFEATQGSDPDSVVLSWDPLANADSYEIYGGSEVDSIDTFLGTASGTVFLHTPPTVLAVHHYRVRGLAPTGPGEWSPAASGYRTFAGPGGVSATQQRYDDRIRIEWDNAQVPVGIKVEYEVWKAPAGAGQESAVLVHTSPLLFFEDTEISPGREYDYWIRGFDRENGNTGGLSAPAAGMSAIQPPFRPDQTIGLRSAVQKGNDIYNLNGGGQSVTIKLTKTRRVRVFSRLGNDGLFPDSFTLVTGGAGKYFSTRLRESFGSRRNVSAASIRGSYRTGEFPSEESRLFELSIIPTRAAKTKGVRKSFYLWSISATDPEHQDRVKASVQTAKPRKSKSSR
ncbi:MAG: hypothetical protein P1U87_05710 [Verrucomicrobiales bacterium]|nr:hypothetical protein [Verrucomicrobiales bacterium]